MSDTVKQLRSVSPVTLIANRLLFWLFYVPIAFMVVNTLVGFILGSPLIEAITVQETVFIIAGMIVSIFQFLISVIRFTSPVVILGHMGDFFVGFLLLGSEYAGLVVKAWLWIFLFPFEMVKLLFGFDLLYLALSFPINAFGIEFDISVTLDIRGLIETIIQAIVDTFTPDIEPLDYLLAKFNGEVVGFNLDTSAITGLMGSSALLNALKVEFRAENKTDDWWDNAKSGIRSWLDKQSED